MQKIKKAVFPVAGLGVRFLPATKASPKEMLPIVDKPLIQYAVEEAVSAGIKEMIFITSSSKRAIEDHFDSNYELEDKLAAAGKTELLSLVQNILPKGVSCAYIRQPDTLGLGHAVLCARPFLQHEEAFAVLLADDLIDAGDQPCLKQMIEQYEKQMETIIAVEKISPSETYKYGIVELKNKLSLRHDLSEIISIVEKPDPLDAPSDLGVVGRYILTPAIFPHLTNIARGQDGEIQLTDALSALLKEARIYALPFKGKRYDCGSKLGYIEATLFYALQHPLLKDNVKLLLKNIDYS